MEKLDMSILQAQKREKENFLIEQMKFSANATKDEKEKYYASIAADNVNAV